MDEYAVREATADDWRTIVAFNQRLARETEGVHLDEATITAGVRNALADRAKARYFVCCRGEEIVGQIMHTWEWSDWRNGMLWWLQSVYVHAEHRGGGVFRRLFEHVRDLARRDENVVGLRLYVEDHNVPAQAVYERLGLASGGYRVMEEIWRR